MKSIQLVEVDASGKITKNERYFYTKLKKHIINFRPEYWNNFIFGKLRRNALKVVFEEFEKLTDMDKKGRNKLDLD